MVEVLANELRADDNSVQETDVKRRKSKSKKQTSASEKLGKPSKMEGLAATAPESPDVLNKSPSQKSQKAVENQGPAEPPKKSKKRKHMVVDPESGTQTPGSSQPKDVSSVEEPPKKKHKNRTEFADPRIDTTLNNQSRKGANEYTYMHTVHFSCISNYITFSPRICISSNESSVQVEVQQGEAKLAYSQYMEFGSSEFDLSGYLCWP